MAAPQARHAFDAGSRLVQKRQEAAVYFHMVDMQASAAAPHSQADLPPFHHVRHRTWQRWTTAL